MTELLLFRVGAAQFAIDLPLISNIQSAKSSIVLQNEGGAGLLQTESGEEIPLFDLAYFFLGNGYPQDSRDKKIMRLELDENPLALIVDRVDQVVGIDNENLEPLSLIFKGPAQACFPFVLKQRDSLVLLLAPEGFVKIAQQPIGKPEFKEPAAPTEQTESEASFPPEPVDEPAEALVDFFLRQGDGKQKNEPVLTGADPDLE